MTRTASSTVGVAALVCLLSGGCGGNASPPTELRRTQAGGLDVVLLATQGTLKQGPDSLVVEFRRGESLVDVGTVRASATMPMPGMAPMMGGFELRPGDAPGRYQIATSLGMAGTWLVNLTWDGPAGQGSASLSLPVR